MWHSLDFSLTFFSPKRKSRRSKHSHKKRRYTSPSSSSSVSHSRIRDYGRYQRNRYSPQAVQDLQVSQPEEVPNIQTMTPEQVIPRPSRDLGSDNESKTWSLDRAINEVFRLLPPELCPRQTEEHAPAKLLSGIELLMESQSTPLMNLPQSKLMENTTKFHQYRINSEKCGKEWVCPPNLVSAITQTKYYKSHSQFFPTDNIPQLESEASLLDLSNKGKCSIPMRNLENWEKRARKLVAINSHADLFSSAAAADNVYTCSVKTFGSRSQIDKTCYCHVYDIGYGNSPSQMQCGSRFIKSAIGEFLPRIAKLSNKLLRLCFPIGLKKLPRPTLRLSSKSSW